MKETRKRTRGLAHLAAAIGATILLAPGATRSVELKAGQWRAWLESPGGELPFGLEIETGESGPRAWISNGDERLPIPEFRVGPTVVFEITHYDSQLEATPSPDGTRLDGLFRKQYGERTYELPFHAIGGSAPRFRPEEPTSAPKDERPLPERWVVDFETRPIPSVALFKSTDDGIVQGTFLNVSGDYRTLAGEFRNGRLRLSRFDGAQAFLFDARMREDGTLDGTFWGASIFQERWTARPDPDAHLLDPFSYLRVERTPDLSAMQAYDLEGTARTLSEALPTGRVVVLEIVGTWCPTCHDASRFLMQLRGEYEDLAVVGLAFEMSQDFERNVATVRRYRKRYEIEYPILLASTGARASPSDYFPPLEGEYAFPTIFFLDRRGRIRATYTGFQGPATGDEHEAMKSRWRALIAQLLAES